MTTAETFNAMRDIEMNDEKKRRFDALKSYTKGVPSAAEAFNYGWECAAANKCAGRPQVGESWYCKVKGSDPEEGLDQVTIMRISDLTVTVDGIASIDKTFRRQDIDMIEKIDKA
jgi:hypothetical protein